MQDPTIHIHTIYGTYSGKMVAIAIVFWSTVLILWIADRSTVLEIYSGGCYSFVCNMGPPIHRFQVIVVFICSFFLVGSVFAT